MICPKCQSPKGTFQSVCTCGFNFTKSEAWASRGLDEIAEKEKALVAHDSEFDRANERDAPKFEYLVLDDISAFELNARGRTGWELVSACSYTTGLGLSINGAGGSSMTVHMRYVMKRPIASQMYSRASELAEALEELAKERSALLRPAWENG